MIIFHEGLPRSGKSYEACVNQIIPTLKKGRRVYTNIDGINHQKFSEVTGLPIEWIQKNLIHISKEQMPTVQEHVSNDSLVLLDELQDYFPTSRQPLEAGITEFVTQHGHRGIDIVCMGQDHRDCHSLWKRRIDTLITFVKRDAIGRPNEYTWTTHKQRLGKFEKLQTGKGSYDSKYFGLYKSHVDGVLEKDSHKDDRTNVFKSSTFKVYIPIFLVITLFAISYVYKFFQPEQPKKMEETLVQKKQEPTIQPVINKPDTKIKPSVQPEQEKPKKPQKYLDKYIEKGRVRLAMIIKTPKGQTAKLEFYDDIGQLQEVMTDKEVNEFGYYCRITGNRVQLIDQSVITQVTMWKQQTEKKPIFHTQAISLSKVVQ